LRPAADRRFGNRLAGCVQEDTGEATTVRAIEEKEMGGAARIFERLAVSPYDFNKAITGACFEEEIVGVAVNRTGIHLDGFRVGGRREERDQNETNSQDFVTLKHVGDDTLFLSFHFVFLLCFFN
jgi:hypothetical protein